MPQYLYHRGTGRLYEIVSADKTANTITLKNDMATFTDGYDKEAFKQRGYFPVKGDDEDEARANAEAKIAAETEAGEEAA